MRVRVGLAAGTRPPGKPRGLPWAPARRREGGCQAGCGRGAAQRPRGREPRQAEQPGGGGGQAPAKPWTDGRTAQNAGVPPLSPENQRRSSRL